MRQYHKCGVEYTTTTGQTSDPNPNNVLQATVLYDLITADNFTDILETDPQSGVDFVYYFVLRPSRAAEDINSLAVS